MERGILNSVFVFSMLSPRLILYTCSLPIMHRFGVFDGENRTFCLLGKCLEISSWTWQNSIDHEEIYCICQFKWYLLRMQNYLYFITVKQNTIWTNECVHNVYMSRWFSAFILSWPQIYHTLPYTFNILKLLSRKPLEKGRNRLWNFRTNGRSCE